MSGNQKIESIRFEAGSIYVTRGGKYLLAWHVTMSRDGVWVEFINEQSKTERARLEVADLVALPS